METYSTYSPLSFLNWQRAVISPNISIPDNFEEALAQSLLSACHARTETCELLAL